MMVAIFVMVMAACLSGFLLFRRRTLSTPSYSEPPPHTLSVIIPARNEADHLPGLIGSLREQTLQPLEILIVDDGSDDGTADIAKSLGVKVITNPKLPSGWTGKTWGCWNGYLKAKGTLFLFLDADVTLSPKALETIVYAREKQSSALSVVPFHVTFKFYERLALLTNVLGVFAFTSPFEKRNTKKGLYGSCILVTRDDYETVGGHQAIHSEMLDDLNLGARFSEAGIPVTNYIGKGHVAFRMYPKGIKSELEGFAKGALLSSGSLSPVTLVFTGFWLVGLILCSLFPFFMGTHYWFGLFIGYLLYTAQLFYFAHFTGKFRVVVPLINGLTTAFFIIIILYSIYQVVFLKRVKWKGREVHVGKDRAL